MLDFTTICNSLSEYPQRPYYVKFNCVVSYIWISIDKTTDVEGCFIENMVVGVFTKGKPTDGCLNEEQLSVINSFVFCDLDNYIII